MKARLFTIFVLLMSSALLALLTLGEVQSLAAQTLSADEFPIETGPTSQGYPDVSGNWVVWADEGQDIYGYDLVTEEKSLLVTAEDGRGIMALALYGNTLVWVEKDPQNNYFVFVQDILSQTKTQLFMANNRHTRHIDIWENMVIWESSIGLKRWIYGYDLGGTQPSPFIIKTFGDCGGCPTARPKISGNLISFRGQTGGIYVLDLLTSAETLIVSSWDCPGGIIVNNGLSDIDGNIVVWGDTRRCSTRDIYGYDLSTGNEFLISQEGAEQGSPRISNEFVVWLDDRQGAEDIYGKNLNSGQEFRVTSTSQPFSTSPPDWPLAVSDNVAVWVDKRSGNSDIYGARLSGGGPGPTPTTTPPPGPNSIYHVEVTQVIQRNDNSVPLIAGKPTFVRVYVNCGTGCTSQDSITGLLRGYNASGELPGSPINSNNPITVYNENWEDQRADLRKTLNFTLPPDWTSGTITLAAEVGGDSWPEQVAFEEAQTLKVAFVPIDYRPFSFSACIVTGQPTDRIWKAHAWAQRIYPTAKIEIVRLYPMIFDQPLATGPVPPFCSQNNDNVNVLFNSLLSWNLLGDVNYVYGWLREGAYGGGIARHVGAQVAFGEDDPNEGQRIFAHEIAHLLGRFHTKSDGCTGPDGKPPGGPYEWPESYPDETIQQWGLDTNGPILKRPDITYDYMSYCGKLSEGNVWTSPWTYEHIYSETLSTSPGTSAIQPLSTQPYFITSGLVYTNHTAILDPIWVISSAQTTANPPAGTEYCLEAQHSSGTALTSYCFDLPFKNYETGEQVGVDGFSLKLPYPEGVARIVLKKGSQELAVRSVSGNIPVVSVLSPNGGEIWDANGTQVITWTASDADGEPLTYSVLYSPDGNNWVPVGVAITKTQVTVNVAELAGGNSAKVRVFATDGVNTGFDEPDDSFTVGSKAPQAFILLPEGTGTIQPGTPLFLQGYAYDLEDAALEEDTLSWESNLDGNLGVGSQALVMLSKGQHIVTLTATDSDGNLATDSISISVGDTSGVYLPIIIKSHSS